MRWQLNRTVALVGMMGAGKTAVGTHMARILGVPFLDSDAEIVKAANMEIPEIFARDGEAFFRDRESEVIARLLRAPQKGILSTGGGAYQREANRKVISEFGISVWLRASADLLWQRVRHKNNRPMLQADNPRARLEELMLQREPHYALAEIVVDAERAYSIDDMAQKVIAALEHHTGVLERR